MTKNNSRTKKNSRRRSKRQGSTPLEAAKLELIHVKAKYDSLQNAVCGLLLAMDGVVPPGEFEPQSISAAKTALEQQLQANFPNLHRAPEQQQSLPA